MNLETRTEVRRSPFQTALRHLRHLRHLVLILKRVTGPRVTYIDVVIQLKYQVYLSNTQ